MASKEFDDRTHLAFLFECASREIRKAVMRSVHEEVGEKYALKHGWMLGYLERQKEPVFPKDLEKTFHFPKSTLADMLQSLDKCGLITKVSVDGDARKKQIIVTEKGKEWNTFMENKIMEAEDYITADISDEQFHEVVQVMEKMVENAMKYKSYIEINKED